jgi:hypothetical protein
MSVNVMQELAKHIANKLGKKYGFFLMVYEHNQKDGRANYVSNSNREDVAKAMEDFIEKSKDSFGAHKI